MCKIDFESVKMTDEATAARRAYQKEWRKKNPDKVKASAARYWNKKAAEAAQPDR